MRTRLPGNQSLLRLQRKCACGGGGKCEECSIQRLIVRRKGQTTRPRVQTKVAVGPVDDPFEREADSVAERVMRMPEASSPAGSAADLSIQRTCASCESEEEDDVVRRKGAGGAASVSGAQDPAVPLLADHTLTQGGHPLTSHVRGFFEQRFGRDFSAVRVHTGSDAHRANVGLHSHAFTYGEHIWFGKGETVGTNHLLAHELAHVVQQRQPSVLKPLHAETNGASTSTASVVETGAAGTVQRLFTPFWEPKSFTSGEANHALVLPAMGAENKIFTEAPIPNARTNEGLGFGDFHGFGLTGRADFYSASTTIGAYFNQHAKPTELKSHRLLQKDGSPYAHKLLAGPKVVGGALIDSGSAPTSIEIGELKPSHGTVEAVVGGLQVEGYKQGIELAHREAIDPATPGDGASWSSLSVQAMTPTSLAVPDKFKHPLYKDQDPQEIVIKKGSSKKVAWNPRAKPVLGRLAVSHDPSNKGVWNYAWVPVSTPSKAQIPTSISSLPAEVTTRIYDPLLQAPVGKKKKARTDVRPEAAKNAGTVAGPQVHTDPAPVIRRDGVAPEKDPFDYDAWKASHKELTEKFNAGTKTQEFKDAEGDILANEAHEALRNKMHLQLPAVEGGKEASEAISKVDFWTGLSALPFGFFRKVFGVAFVKVAQFFIRMRDKVRDFIGKMEAKAGVGSGALGAALKAAFTGLKMIMKFVATRVTNRLMQSLATGVMNKLTAMIPSEVSDELEVQKAKVEKIREDIEKKALDTVDALLEKAFGVHLKDLERLHTVYQGLNAIVTIVNLVRWGARVIACLSPPAWGCLWILAEGALDFALQKVAETCWFQKKIQPILAKVEYVSTELPNQLGDAVIGKVKGFLPDSVSDVFADLETTPVSAGEEDLPCEEGMDSTEYNPSPVHQDMEDLYRQLGDERAQALQDLARAMNVPKDRALNPAELRRLGSELSKLDPQAIRDLAKNYPAAAADSPTPVMEALKDIEGGRVQDVPVTPQEGETEVDKTQQPPAEGEGDEGEDEGGGLKSVDASSRHSSAVPSGEIPETRVHVVNPSWSHTRGTETTINVVVFQKGVAIIAIRNIQVKVAQRSWWPEGAKSEEDAAQLVVTYTVMQGVDVPEVPGGSIGTGTTLRAALLTQLGQQAMSIVRNQQAAGAK